MPTGPIHPLTTTFSIETLGDKISDLFGRQFAMYTRKFQEVSDLSSIIWGYYFLL